MSHVVITALNIALAITNVIMMVTAALVVRMPRQARNAWFGRPQPDATPSPFVSEESLEPPQEQDNRPRHLQF